MKKMISMAVLAVMASAASAGVDCTHTIPQLVGRNSVESPPGASGPRQQALLGCNEGDANLLLPGVGVFSWEAAQGSGFFLSVFLDQAEKERKRLDDILDCYNRAAACYQKADAQLARGEVACSGSKIVFSASRSGDRWGAGISLETAAPGLYGSCNAGNEAAVIDSRHKCGDIVQTCRRM